MSTGLTLIDDYWYYFTGSGAMQTGWQFIAGECYYFEPGGWAPKGWKWIDGNCYYFHEDGHMASDEKIGDASVNEYGQWCHAHWVYDASAKKYRYMESIGMYIFNGPYEIDGKIYCFDEYGYMMTGWQHLEGKWYYFEPGGWQAKGWKWIDGNCYYFYEDGHMASDETIEGAYVNASGQWCYAHWIYDETVNKYWYMLENGEHAQNGPFRIGGKWYCFDKYGYMQTGWVHIRNSVNLFDGWYYFDESGQMHDGWLQEGSNWYYFREERPMAAYERINIDGGLYYFGSNGQMQTGMVRVLDVWYYFGPDGKSAQGWTLINGYYYYFYEDGHMAVNETTPDGFRVDQNGVWVE